MTIKDLKEKVATLQAVYQKNKLERFLLSQSSKVKQIKEEIANSGLPYSELIKHIPPTIQSTIDMIILPPNNSLNKVYLTITEFESQVKLSDNLSINFWKVNKKLAHGNLNNYPYNLVFNNYTVNNDTSITIGPLNFVELAKENINSSQIPVDKLSDRQLFYALCSTIPYKNETVDKIIQAITNAYENGNKDVAFYNIAAMSIMCNQFNLRIYGCKRNSFYMPIAKTLLIAEDDEYSVCLHELGHAIHYILLGKVTPPNFLRLYHLCQVNMKENEEAFQILISALNNYYISIEEQQKNITNDIRKTMVDENLDKVIEEQISAMDNEALKQIIDKYVLPIFKKQYLEMLETNRPKLLSGLKLAILNYSANQVAQANHNQDEAAGFGLDAISGIAQGFDFKPKNSNSISILTGHSKNYYAENPHNMFIEMFANYNVCKAYGNNVAIKQLKKTIGPELFNYLENLYDGYLSGLSRKGKNPRASKNNESFEKFYIEALNTSQISASKKQELLDSMNLAIYEDENQILYSLYNYLMPEFKFELTKKHLINFLSNPNYFKENEQFKSLFSPEFLEELDTNVNFGTLREFILKNFSQITDDELFQMIVQKHEANKDNRCILYQGEPSYKIINGYCRKFDSYYTSFGTKISIDERYKSENIKESLVLALQMLSILQLEVPNDIKEIQISTNFENTLVNGILSLTSIDDLSDEIAKYNTRLENKSTKKE